MKALSKKQIITQLKQLGLSKSDHVIVHSALSCFGKVTGGADTVIDAVLESVGKNGTVVVPTFGCGDEVFDPAKSQTGLGIIPQVFWKRKDALRSRHPLASVAAIGEKAEWLTSDHETAKIAHGSNTPYARLTEVGGKILLLGVDQDRNTFLHTIEELAYSAYLKTKKAKYLDKAGRTQTSVSKYFPGPHRNFIGIQSWLEEEGLTSKIRIGNCMAQLMPMKPLLEKLSKKIKENPDLFISKNPNLPDGIWQRADIIRSQFDKEAFTIAADSQFAGRYMEEIIDNLKRFGIDKIVLSFVNNTCWDKIEKQKRRWYLQGLRQAKIKVAALKLPVLNKNTAEVLTQSGTRTLIVPITSPISLIKQLQRKEINVFLENTLVNSTQTLEKLNNMIKQKTDVKLVFNPLGFVQCGENPFLYTYTRTSLKRHIGMLFINDGLATGQRTPLEEGLGEIKELISILRCKSFSGLMILQGTDDKSFEQTAGKFITILKELGHAV